MDVEHWHGTNVNVTNIGDTKRFSKMAMGSRKGTE